MNTVRGLPRRCTRLAVLLLALAVLAALPLPVLAAAPAGDAADSSLCFPYAPRQPGGDTATLLLTAAPGAPTVLTIHYFLPDGREAADLQPLTLAPNATAVIDLAAQPNLPAGVYHVVAAANRPLQGAAHIRNSSTLLGVYAAVNCAGPSDTLFGPFYAGSKGGEQSVLHLVNNGPTPAALTLNFLDQAGQLTHTAGEFTIPPSGSLQYTTDDGRENFQFPVGYGRVQVVTTSTTLHGVLARRWQGAMTYANALRLSQHFAGSGAMSKRYAVPRIHHDSGETGLPLTTQLFLVAAGDSGGGFSARFVRANGFRIGLGWSGNIYPGMTQERKIVMLDPAAPARGVSAAIVESEPPLAITAEILFPASAAGLASTNVDSLILPAAGGVVTVPGLLLTESAFSIFAVQNVSDYPQTLTVEIFDAQGASVYTLQQTTPAEAALAVDLREVAGLPQPFYGVARVSGSPKMIGQVDHFSKVALPAALFLPAVKNDVPGNEAVPTMITIPAGPFQMGCDLANTPKKSCSVDEELRTVTVDTFAIDKYEVTNARYAACMAAGVCEPPRSFASSTRPDYFTNPFYGNFPVINVTLWQANIFCLWDRKVLPSAAEWQKAARGSSDTRPFPWGIAQPDCTLANARGCAQDTSPAGGYSAGASPYGVMDMAGNVAELVNQTESTTGSAYLRGGSWQDSALDPLRLAYRTEYWTTDPSNTPAGPTIGFRCVRRGS